MNAFIHDLIAKAASVTVLVVGDVMLDEYISGTATRISPEAPVPVVAVRLRRSVPGGAANVAANVAALGASVALSGVTGADDAAQRLRDELSALGIARASLVVDSSRPTTTKTRVTAAGQQIVRFDAEATGPLPDPVMKALRSACEAALPFANVCVLSDYAKGTLSADLCQWLIAAATARGLPVVVDPKSADFTRYRGATVITPNLRETLAASTSPHNSLADAVVPILQAISPSSLLVTRGEEGMSLFEQGSEEIHFPASVNEVADVTGAGDTVVSVLAVALGAGFSLSEAAALANLAAGVAVGHHGTWAVSAAELIAGTL